MTKNKQCGEKTEAFIRNYAPRINTITCNFATTSDADSFLYPLNTDLYRVIKNSDEPETQITLESRDVSEEILSLAKLNDLIEYTTQYRRQKLTPVTPHNYCQIELRVFSILKNGDGFNTLTTHPLHCPEFEHTLPHIKRDIRKEIADQNRNFPT